MDLITLISRKYINTNINKDVYFFKIKNSIAENTITTFSLQTIKLSL